MMPSVTERLHAEFEPYWMNELDDLEAFIAREGSRIEAICTGAHTGVRTERSLIARLPSLRIISNYGVGYDSIDLPEAGRRRIVVTNTPDVLTEEVADTTIGLLLMTVRELSRAESWLRAGQWAATGVDYPYTPSLRDRSIGLVGYGRIGKAIGRRLEAFGIPLSYYGRKPQPDVPYPFYNDLVAMAEDVDTLIAILPGGPATQNLIDARVLEALGPNGVFINMARGSVVDEAALKTALRNGTILAAGLDVFMNEPRIDTDLFTIPNLTLLPHVGSASLHTRTMMGNLTMDNLMAYKQRKPPLTPVPETPFKGW
jgi:lactate dehydrogenase-like 2-hydroxyacid dehydrogenase